MGRRSWEILAIGVSLVLLAGCQGLPGDTSSVSARTPKPCTPKEIREVVDRFIDAFNRGDLTQLDQLVSVGRFGWYSTDAPGQRFNAEASNRDTLMAYFAARHRQHEHLALTSLDVTYTDAQGGGFWFRLTRSADGLPPTAYNGKGGVQCATMPISLTVWAMDPLPWSPLELLPKVAALILGAAAIGTIILWRRRTARRSAGTTKPHREIAR